MKFELTFIALLIAISAAVLTYDTNRHRDPERLIQPEAASKTIERLKDWSTWLTGICTAAMAAMGLITKDRDLRSGQRRCGFFALFFLGTSLLLSVWLVALLPGIQLQLSSSNAAANDLYRHSFDTLTHVQLTGLLVLQHIYFVLGIASFATMIYLFFPYGREHRKEEEVRSA
jgi:hypothetical protein